MSILAVVYQSGKGHTRILAEAVLNGIQQVVSGNTFEIAGKDVHEGRFHNPGLMGTLDSSDGIVFGCATYMGSASAIFKLFWRLFFFPTGWNNAGKTRSPPASRTRLCKMEISFRPCFSSWCSLCRWG